MSSVNSCIVEGCERDLYARGMCRPHYTAAPKIRPGKGGRKPLPVSERIHANSKPNASGCWIWQGAMGDTGYGKMGVGSMTDFSVRLMPAHRASYEAFVGPIPEGLTIHHRCYTRACVNPGHLEPMSILDNQRDASARITHCKHGHEFTPDNTCIRGDTGRRTCRACRRRTTREYEQRKKVAA